MHRSVLATLLTFSILAIPTRPLTAQDVASMVVRIHDDGTPVANVRIVAYANEAETLLGTTAASGLASLELGGGPLAVGARVSVTTVRCGEEVYVLLKPAAGPLPVATDACDRTAVGALIWGGEERLVVALGDAPGMQVLAPERRRQAVTGFRVDGGGLVSVPGGSDLEGLNTGFGGQLQLGVDYPGGFGIGGGAAFTRHDLDGSDEKASYLSVFAEPRYTFAPQRPGPRAYVAGRLAYASLRFDEGANLLNESGGSFGVGVGVVIPLVGSTFLDLWTRISVLRVGTEGANRTGSDLRVGGSVRL